MDADKKDMPEPKLTLRQQFFLRHYTDPESPGFGNATRAAELAGYTAREGSNQLAVQGHNNLRNPSIRQAIERILDEAGCTVQHAALRLREAMDAVQVRVFQKKNGDISYSDPLPDHKERRRAAEFVLRLRGFLQARAEGEPGEPPNLGQQEEVPEEVSLECLEFRARILQLHPVDRSLLRTLFQKKMRLFEIYKRMIIAEKFGKPYEEVEKELNQEAGRRVAEDLKDIWTRTDAQSEPDIESDETGGKQSDKPG